MKFNNFEDIKRALAGRRTARGRDFTPAIAKRNSSGRTPAVSVILLDWGCRERFFSLDWLKDQDAPETDYEVIWVELYDRVVDDALLKADTVITCGQKGLYHKHAGYNAGLLNAKGSIICVCDSDAVFPPDFISSIISNFRGKEPGKFKSMVLMHHEWRTSFEYPPGPMGINDVKDKARWKWWPLVPNAGACVSMRKEDIIRFGGFDEHASYRGYICGPYELAWRLVNAGLPQIWHDPESVALWHFAHPDPVGTNGVRTSMKRLFESRYPHVDMHALKAVEAFSTGRVLPLKENKDIFRLRLRDRVIGSEFEAKYSDLTGPEGFPALLTARLKVEGVFSLLKKILLERIERALKPLRGWRVCRRLEGYLIKSRHGGIVKTHRAHNILSQGDTYYGIPQWIGAVDLNDEKRLECDDIIKARSCEEVKKLIDSAPFKEPVLLEEYRGFNIVRYRDLFYGVPRAIGNFDLMEPSNQSSPMVVRAASLKDIRRMIKTLPQAV